MSEVFTGCLRKLQTPVQLTGFQGAASTKSLISGVPGCVHVLRLKAINLKNLLFSAVTAML